MKTVIRLEELLLAALAVYLFVPLGFAWWWLAVLFLTPDLGSWATLPGRASARGRTTWCIIKG